MSRSTPSCWVPTSFRGRKSRPVRRRPLAADVLEAREVPTAFTWDGPAGGGLWSNPQNWVGDVAPTPLDLSVTVTFNTAVSSVQDIDNLSVDRVTFAGPSGTIQLNKSLALD